MRKLSKLFFSLAGLTLAAGILFVIDDATALSVVPKSVDLFSGYITLLFLLFIFSLLGCYFAQRQFDTYGVGISPGVKYSKIDWPFYIMALGLLFPFITFLSIQYIWQPKGPEARFGAAGFLVLSFIVGGIFIVSSIIIFFVKRRK